MIRSGSSVPYGSSSRADARDFRYSRVPLSALPSFFSPYEHSTGIMGGTADEMR